MDASIEMLLQQEEALNRVHLHTRHTSASMTVQGDMPNTPASVALQLVTVKLLHLPLFKAWEEIKGDLRWRWLVETPDNNNTVIRSTTGRVHTMEFLGKAWFNINRNVGEDAAGKLTCESITKRDRDKNSPGLTLSMLFCRFLEMNPNREDRKRGNKFFSHKEFQS